MSEILLKSSKMCAHRATIENFDKYIKTVWVLFIILPFGSFTETPLDVGIKCLQFMLQKIKCPVHPKSACTLDYSWTSYAYTS